MQHELLEHSTQPDITAPAGPFAPYPRCAVLTMIKDEADIIHASLSWHYHIGVRRFVILDNKSTDGTASEIARFRAERPEAQVVVIDDPVVAHYQAEKTTGIAQVAQQLWPDIDWVLPVDADEFCIARHGLVALAYVPDRVEALTVPKTVHFFQAGRIRDGGHILARLPVRSGLFVVPPKVIVRAKPYLGVTQGNHKARRADGGPVRYTGGFQYGFYHREFQTRSFAQFVRKIRNGGAAILAARAEGRMVGGEHWLALHQVLKREGEQGLRQRFDIDCCRSPGSGYVLDPFSGAS